MLSNTFHMNPTSNLLLRTLEADIWSIAQLVTREQNLEDFLHF